MRRTLWSRQFSERFDHDSSGTDGQLDDIGGRGGGEEGGEVESGDGGREGQRVLREGRVEES